MNEKVSDIEIEEMEWPEAGGEPPVPPSPPGPGEPIFPRRGQGRSKGPVILAVVSAKGGSGQSVLCANLGVYMAQTGRKVLLCDAQRWGRNLHTLLGLPRPERSLDDLPEDSGSVTDLIADTPYATLKLLSGLRENPTLGASVSPPALNRRVVGLPFDFVLLDLGPSVSFALLDHALWADHVLLVGLPEPTAMENTYELLRSLYFRLFKTIEVKLGIEEVVEKAMMNGRDLGIRTPRNLVSAVRFFDPKAGDRMEKEIERLKLRLIMNQVRSAQENDSAQAFASVAQRYFGFRIDVLGGVDHDSAVPSSVRRRKPLHLVQKDARAVRQIEQIAHKLLAFDILEKPEEAGA